MTSAHDDITVVIAHYNYGRFLNEAIDSALAQEGGPPRIILVDDGSTEPGIDATLDALPDAVQVIRQANAGCGAARNTGMAAATTPYLLTLDADDRLPPHTCTMLRRPLDEDPTLGFAYGVMRYFGDWEGLAIFPDYDPYKLLYRHMIGSSALLRREVFEDTGGYDPTFPGFEDWDFWLNALSCGWRGRRVDAETLEYRRHGPSLIGARTRYREWWPILRRKYADLYAREGELARETGASLMTRAIYRGYWGPRPIPASVEQRLYRLIWRPRG